MNAQSYPFPDRSVVKFDLKVVDGYGSVSVNGPVDSKAEDVFKVFKGGRDEEFPKDTLLFSEGSLITKVRDFAGC